VIAETKELHPLLPRHLELRQLRLPLDLLSHSHTHTLTHSHTHIHTVTLTHLHTHTLTHSHTHTLTQSHAHTLTLSHLHTHDHPTRQVDHPEITA